MRKFLKRLMFPARWHDMRTTKPLSNVFGFDRGNPVDRYYIEKFIRENSSVVKGRVLEIGDDTYSLKFGTGIIQQEILHFTEGNARATIIGDLTKPDTLPQNSMDCFICTQTFNFIYDFKSAISGAFSLLKKDGVLLATVGGLSQVSRYDMDRWGDYWRFTSRSAAEIFGEIFGKENVEIKTYGNVLAAVALLHGVSLEELTRDELDVVDQDYQVIITIVARKK